MTTGNDSDALVAVGELRELGRDLVEAGEDEAVELDLADRAVAAHREPDRGADDAGLGERGVEHAVLAELAPAASVTRKTPPSGPMSSPMSSDLGRRPRAPRAGPR